MISKLLLFAIVMIVVIKISEQSDYRKPYRFQNACENCEDNVNSYKRIKRAKYYSSPNIRYSRRPFRPEFPKGYFSYTPPPNYLIHDDEYPNVPDRAFYNKNFNNNLDDEDINNLFKNLSKDDLKKILEFTNDNDKENRVNNVNEPKGRPYNLEQLNSNVPQNKVNGGFFNTAPIYVPDNQQNTATFDGPQANNINERFNNMMPINRGSIPVLFTDNRNVNEEVLPKPINLREESISNDFEIAYTKDVPTFAQPSSAVVAGSKWYKVESFGHLPLSEHNSKLSTVNSYSVPHYSVGKTSMKAVTNNVALRTNVPQIESAPSAMSDAAHSESDAHLKAIKIWTHVSSGTAYTLHDDGTLSLEKAGLRPKFSPK